MPSSLPHSSTNTTIASIGAGLPRVLLQRLNAANWIQQLQGLDQSLPSDATSLDDAAIRQQFSKASLAKTPLQGDYLHPCWVDNLNTLIHARDLATRNPAFYTQLQAFAEREGYVLLADRREQDGTVAIERRRSWLPVLFLSLGMNMASAQSAEPSSQATLGLFETPLSQTIEAHDKSLLSAHQGQAAIAELSAEAVEIEAILQQHYVADGADPQHIGDDLRDMAQYFSQYPEAVQLLTSLKGLAWQLNYRPNTFETEVRGNPIQVRSVKVHFDSRSAAQLRTHRACAEKRGACVASPADALLHELLHAQSALLHSAEFIAQGGMSSVLYPYAHEAAVIKSENVIYKSMSALDGNYRPIRHAHSGQVVASACATCLH